MITIEVIGCVKCRERGDEEGNALEGYSNPHILVMINGNRTHWHRPLGMARSSVGSPYGIVLRHTSGEGGDSLRSASCGFEAQVISWSFINCIGCPCFACPLPFLILQSLLVVAV